MMFDEFEARCAAEPDLELTWIYWNCLLPDTAPRYFTLFVVLPFLRELRLWSNTRGTTRKVR